MKRFGPVILFALMCSALAGCNTTKGVGYANPDYSGYRLTNTAIFVDVKGSVGDKFEAELVEKLQKRGLQAKSVRNLSRFARDQDDFLDKVWTGGSHELLVVGIDGDSSSESVSSYSMFGNASTYGGTTTASGSMVPMRTFHRSTSAVAHVLLPTGEKAWESNIERSASGLLFVGSGHTVGEIAEELIANLERDRLIQK